MTLAQMTVCSLDDMENMVDQKAASHLISLINRQMMPRTPLMLHKSNHLKLSMNDIVSPVTGSITPSNTHVEQLVEFIRNWDQDNALVVHCWAGISRSTAAAYITLCALNPDMDELRIARRLRKISPTATPNNLLIACADEYLDRSGRMIAAIKDIGRGNVASSGKPFSTIVALDGGKP